MRRISYYRDASGIERAKWPGKTVYINGEARKEGQINLGLVIDKTKNIFWNRKNGYITFDPMTEKISWHLPCSGMRSRGKHQTLRNLSPSPNEYITSSTVLECEGHKNARQASKIMAMHEEKKKHKLFVDFDKKQYFCIVLTR